MIYRENHRKTIENWRLHQEEVGPMVCGRCMQLDERNQTQLITGGGTHCNWQYFHKDTTVKRDIYILHTTLDMLNMFRAYCSTTALESAVPVTSGYITIVIRVISQPVGVYNHDHIHKRNLNCTP